MNAITYENPVLKGCHPDPSVCKVGSDYYLATSSFEYFPGVPIFHSVDLVHWHALGHALCRPAQLPLEGQASSKGIFAPTLRYHRGTFYLVTTNVGHRGNFYVTARDPAGPWSDPVWLDEADGWMDPSLFFDDDGKVYYTRHHGGRHGVVVQAELDVERGKLLGSPREIWSGTGGIWPEGPHLYKVRGYYYLLISEGGTSYDHSLTIARSRSPWGPFESNPNNPILTHRHLPELPIQAVGHADLVEGPNGGWFIVFLGVRPCSSGHHHLGRETFLAEVTWNDAGWPEVNGGAHIERAMRANITLGEPTPALTRDDFARDALGPNYEFVRADAGCASLLARPGYLRLTGNAHSLDDVAAPAFVGRRQPEFDVVAETRIEFEPAAPEHEAGLVIRGDESHHYALLVVGAEPNQRRVVLRSRTHGETRQLGALDVQNGAITLRIEASREHYEFSAQDAATAEPVHLGRAATAALSAESRGLGFTGVRLGLYASSRNASEPMPPADFEYFDVEPAP